MKKVLSLLLLIIFGIGFAQKVKKEEKVKDQFESRQPQDMSAPPPPMVAFPAQYPKGNKAFLNDISKNLDQSALQTLNKNVRTKIIFKIDSDGNVVNVSTYGDHEVFNSEVKKAAEKATYKVKWEPGKNKKGEKVIDIVTLPFSYSNR